MHPVAMPTMVKARKLVTRFPPLLRRPEGTLVADVVRRWRVVALPLAVVHDRHHPAGRWSLRGRAGRGDGAVGGEVVDLPQLLEHGGPRRLGPCRLQGLDEQTPRRPPE